MAFSNSDLSVALYFDLDNNQYRIKDNSDYVSEGISESDIRGVYKLTDPNEKILNNNTDFNNPDVATSINADLYSAYKSFTAANGDYTLVYAVYDSNTTTEYTKTFTYTYASSDIPDVSIGVESDVGLATLSSTDETAYPTDSLDSRTHKLTYPLGNEVSQTSLVNDTISITDLHTGEYTSTVTSVLSIENDDDLILNKTITGTQEHNVWDTDGMYAVRSALDTFYDRWQTAQTSNPKEGRRLEGLWIEISANYAMFNAHKQNGDVENAGEYLNNIKTILVAESIDTEIDPSVSVPVSAVLPGYAAQWLDGSGAPAASLGRTVDYYFNTDTNGVYSKSTGSWVNIGTLGSNTLIEYSDTGGSLSSSWDSAYSNGLNFIRFSGDGGTTYSNSAQFIDGYRYVAYASDASGSDFICDDDPSFTFNAVLEYRAEKKFDESHNGDLIASDFTGLFTKYRDNGIIAYCTTPSVSISTDADGNNAVFPTINPEVVVYDGDTDVTLNWTITINTATNVTASVVNNNEVDITAISANLGSILIDCDRSGYDTLQVLIGVHKTKEGQAVVDSTAVDKKSIEYVDSYGKVGNSLLVNVELNSDIAKLTKDTIAYWNSSAQELQTYKFGVDESNSEIRNKFYQIGNGLFITATFCRIVSLLSTRIALIDEDNAELKAYDWDGSGWTLASNALSVTLVSTTMLDIAALSSTRIAILSRDNLTTYDLSASTWSKTGNTLDVTTEGISFNVQDWGGISGLSSTDVVLFCAGNTPTTGNQSIVSFTFDGTNWSIRTTTYASTAIGSIAHDVVYVGEDSSGFKYVVTASVGGDGDYLLVWSLENNNGQWSISNSYDLNTSNENGIHIALLQYTYKPDDFSLAVASVENSNIEYIRPFQNENIIIPDKAIRSEHLSDDITDGTTTQINEDRQIEVKDNAVTKDKLASDIVDNSSIGINDLSEIYIKLDNSFFMHYGTALSIAGASQIGLCALTDYTIAFYDNNTTTLSTYSVASNTWTKVGNSLDISGDFAASSSTTTSFGMAALDSSTIAFVQSQSNISVHIAYLMTYSWDGTDWSLSGNKLDILPGIGLGSPSASALDSSTVAVVADFAGINLLKTYSWNGTDWSQDGNSYSLTNNPDLAHIATLTSTSIVYFDNRNGMQAYSWDGTDWTTLGNEYSLSGGGYSCVAALSENQVVTLGTDDDLFKSYIFDQTNWTLVGNSAKFSAGNTQLKMDVVNDKMIVIFSPSGDSEITSFLRVVAV